MLVSVVVVVLVIVHAVEIDLATTSDYSLRLMHSLVQYVVGCGSLVEMPHLFLILHS